MVGTATSLLSYHACSLGLHGPVSFVDYHFLEEAGRVIESADRGWLALSRRQRDVWERRQTVRQSSERGGCVASYM